MKRSSAAIVLLLAGCVQAQPTFTADGKKGHVISCSPVGMGGLVGGIAAASTSWGTCYQKAGEICGERGFDVLERSGEQGAVVGFDRYGGGGTTTNNRMMVVQCKGDEPHRTVAANAKKK